MFSPLNLFSPTFLLPRNLPAVSLPAIPFLPLPNQKSKIINRKSSIHPSSHALHPHITRRSKCPSSAPMLVSRAPAARQRPRYLANIVMDTILAPHRIRHCCRWCLPKSRIPPPPARVAPWKCCSPVAPKPSSPPPVSLISPLNWSANCKTATIHSLFRKLREREWVQEVGLVKEKSDALIGEVPIINFAEEINTVAQIHAVGWQIRAVGSPRDTGSPVADK